MPIYDYECTSCGHKAEIMRKISEPNLSACPQCGQATFAKQVSAPSFQLTGSGWYATDFKSGNSKPTTKTEADPKAEAAVPSAPTACATGCACH